MKPMDLNEFMEYLEIATKAAGEIGIRCLEPETLDISYLRSRVVRGRQAFTMMHNILTTQEKTND